MFSSLKRSGSGSDRSVVIVGDVRTSTTGTRTLVPMCREKVPVRYVLGLRRGFGKVPSHWVAQGRDGPNRIHYTSD